MNCWKSWRPRYIFGMQSDSSTALSLSCIVETMLAAVERSADKIKPERLCVVRWTGRVRLHVEVLTVCGDSIDAADGVVQVPEFILAGRPVPSIAEFGGVVGKPLKICEDCKRVIG